MRSFAKLLGTLVIIVKYSSQRINFSYGWFAINVLLTDRNNKTETFSSPVLYHNNAEHEQKIKQFGCRTSVSSSYIQIREHWLNMNYR